MAPKNLEDLELWQLARSLTGKIYKLTRDGGCLDFYRSGARKKERSARFMERTPQEQFKAEVQQTFKRSNAETFKRSNAGTEEVHHARAKLIHAKRELA
ncbi:MAG: hypothetical protein KKC76_15175 [Proteobacteria bacterium]|nr:hypothetical protein [Pseudomonadota bacterium]MBU4296144.1 hypothetical protein [Pseudomonadota bacterium]MCG2747462.1 hypothetical protein [Desulfobulbaceae bacterium]